MTLFGQHAIVQIQTAGRQQRQTFNVGIKQHVGVVKFGVGFGFAIYHLKGSKLGRNVTDRLSEICVEVADIGNELAATHKGNVGLQEQNSLNMAWLVKNLVLPT